MIWYQLHIDTQAQTTEQIETLCFDLGALSITWTDSDAKKPIYEPPIGTTPIWSESHGVILFDNPSHLSHCLKQLESNPTFTLLNIRTEEVADQNWAHLTQKDFDSLNIGERLCITNSWAKTKPQWNRIQVLLDPGIAFGTGAHPTTQLCLEWLDQVIDIHCQVLDMGCGSGILSIAAAKLGAEKIWAVDIDPQALEATCLNALSNDLPDGKIQALTTLPHDINYNCVVANILSNTLIDFAPKLLKGLLPEGQIALTGILAHQVDDVIKAYEPHVDFEQPVYKDEWVLIYGRLLTR